MIHESFVVLLRMNQKSVESIRIDKIHFQNRFEYFQRNGAAVPIQLSVLFILLPSHNEHHHALLTMGDGDGAPPYWY